MWLLETSILHAMRAAAPNVTAEQQQAYENAVLAEEGTRGLTIAGGTARINVEGVLTDAPNFLARWFGGGNTVYSDIVRATAEADADPNVETIEYYFASGGGQASAEWFAAMEAIKRAKKPTKAYVGSVAASAAYGLASQADEIVAQNALSALGSVGVVVRMLLDESVVEITSTNAPDKRPDASTEEGKATIRAQLDQIENKFISAIAEGRDTDVENVKNNYGRGAVLYAEEAKKRGMIDSISNQSTTATTTGGKTTTGASTMDLTKLKAEHPAVYLAAVQEGVSQERDRVSAHLELGEASEAMDIAIGAIKDGKEHSASLNAKYQAAAIASIKKQKQADDDTSATESPAPQSQGGDDFADQVAADVAAQLGVEGDE